VGKGTGLGLSTVYGIIKQSGGEIEVMTEPGKGTTFDIFLPEVVEPIKASVEIAPASMVKVEGKETILLAEDEEGVRELISHILTQQGFKVLEASNGHEALEVCRQHHSELHLLITDLIMPRMSGRELADQITALRPEVAVLFISGYTDDALVRRGETFGRTGFLQKPFVPSELLQKVRQLLDANMVKTP
jgi:CheY-like chemotaxis protein